MEFMESDEADFKTPKNHASLKMQTCLGFILNVLKEQLQLSATCSLIRT